MDEEKVTFSCSLCSVTFSSKNNLNLHNKRFHIPELKKETLEKYVFYSDEEFKTWKYEMEKSTCSQYVVKRGAKKNITGDFVVHYICNRSGTYNCLKDRKRNVRKKGSIKSGVKCTARIKVVKSIYFEAMEINVIFFPTHRGHTHDPSTLKLTTPEKMLLAGQMAQGIPRKTILKNIPSMYNPSKRLLMTTLKDLHNIKASYKIDDCVTLHRNDAKLIDITVTELKKEKDNPVLIYKPQGELSSEIPEFQKDDFLLGIMNETQLDFFIAYGNNIIRVDSTHGTNIYDIQLTTIMVSDASEEGLPVAILFSNRESTDVYKAFFSAIKKYLQTTHISISPKIFMSDIAPGFYNAWESVFGPAEKYLFCTWRVKRAFNGNLYVKIPNPEVRKQVRDELHAMHHEADKITFRQMLESYTKKWLSNEESKAFGEYFQKHFKGRPEQWAYGFRQQAANIKMKLENWHKAIKYNEPEGNVMKQLTIVMNAIRTILLSRVINIHWPEGNTLIEGLHKRHKQSTEIPNDGILQVQEYVWSMSSSESILDLYEIRFHSDSCCSECDLKCDVCHSCIHMYSCSCPDNSVAFNMCKHIHKVCALYPRVVNYRLIDDIPADGAEMDDLPVDDVVTVDLPSDVSISGDLLYVATKSLCNESFVASNQLYKAHGSSFETRKNELLSVLHGAISRASAATSHEDLDTMMMWSSSFFIRTDTKQHKTT